MIFNLLVELLIQVYILKQWSLWKQNPKACVGSKIKTWQVEKSTALYEVQFLGFPNLLRELYESFTCLILIGTLEKIREKLLKGNTKQRNQTKIERNLILSGTHSNRHNDRRSSVVYRSLKIFKTLIGLKKKKKKMMMKKQWEWRVARKKRKRNERQLCWIWNK